MDKVFKFEIVTLGSSVQQLKESDRCINRPMIDVDDKIKKWGDEYIIIYNGVTNKNIKGKKYVGSFAFDKHAKKFLKLFKEIDIPIDIVDYYIVSLKLESIEKINKTNAFIKQNNSEYSCILSCAYNKLENNYKNELLIVCQHNDKLLIDGNVLVFDEDLKVFS